MRRRAIALAASAFALSVLLALSPLPLGAAPALAGDAVDTGQFDAILEMDQNPPAGFNADTDENPYGHAKDQPFLMNVESELMMYSVSEGTILDPEPEVHANWYDGWSGEGGDLGIEDGVSKGSFEGMGSYGEMSSDLTYVESVAFDPTGSGRDDHAAYVGYDPDAYETVDAAERDALVSVGWVDEGVAWYGVKLR